MGADEPEEFYVLVPVVVVIVIVALRDDKRTNSPVVLRADKLAP